MSRVQKIIQHPTFRHSLEKNELAEKERIFCCHEMTHFIDVSRLGYIFALERGYQLEKDVIYAAGLLHDIGRWKQYQDGTPHDEAGAELAEPILRDSGYSEQEICSILGAIREHRSENDRDELTEVLYDADKASRCCWRCEAEPECNWSAQKKNLQIIW